MGVTIFSGSHSFQWKSFALLEAIHFSEKCYFLSKLFLLVEVIIFSGKHWPIVILISFSGNCSFYWKPFHSMEAIAFIGSHPF